MLDKYIFFSIVVLELKENKVPDKECTECERRKDYIIHLLRKQNVVLGLNDQDVKWLEELGIEVQQEKNEDIV